MFSPPLQPFLSSYYHVKHLLHSFSPPNHFNTLLSITHFMTISFKPSPNQLTLLNPNISSPLSPSFLVDHWIKSSDRYFHGGTERARMALLSRNFTLYKQIADQIFDASSRKEISYFMEACRFLMFLLVFVFL